MAAPKLKTVVTMRLEGHCPSHSRTDVRVSNTEFTIDEPVARGGTNQGPSPTETLMGSLAGCTNVISHKVAEKYGVVFKKFHVDVVAKFDRRGVTLAEEIDLPFDDIQVLINVMTDADPAALEKVKTDLPKFCPFGSISVVEASSVAAGVKDRTADGLGQ